MDQDLERREREAPRGVDHPGAAPVPAPAGQPRALAVEGRVRALAEAPDAQGTRGSAEDAMGQAQEGGLDLFRAEVGVEPRERDARCPAPDSRCAASAPPCAGLRARPRRASRCATSRKSRSDSSGERRRSRLRRASVRAGMRRTAERVLARQAEARGHGRERREGEARAQALAELLQRPRMDQRRSAEGPDHVRDRRWSGRLPYGNEYYAIWQTAGGRNRWDGQMPHGPRMPVGRSGQMRSGAGQTPPRPATYDSRVPRTLSRCAARRAVTSSSRSPPVDSRSASARTNASMASQMTPQAETAVTSLRS